MRASGRASEIGYGVKLPAIFATAAAATATAPAAAATAAAATATAAAATAAEAAAAATTVAAAAAATEAATTAAATATEAATTATAGTRGALVRFIHTNCAAIQFLTVHFRHRGRSGCVVLERHETESAGATRLSVNDDLDLIQLSEALEPTTKAIVGGVPAQAAYEQFLGHLFITLL